MFKCGKKNKETTIQEILGLMNDFQRLFASPDLDEWRRLNVPMAQLKSLYLISSRPSMNSHTLADNLAVTPGNVTGIVDRLVEQELVIRKPDPQDRRVIWLEATPKGKDLLAKLMENHSKQFAVILDSMRAADVKALAVGLKGLIKAVEEHISELKVIKPGE